MMKLSTFRGYAVALCLAVASMFAVPAAAHERYGLFDFPILIDARAVNTVAHDITRADEAADAALLTAVQRERTIAFNRRLLERSADPAKIDVLASPVGVTLLT